MKVLIACEFSGIVRDAFIECGHDAISCDLLPTESTGPHIQGDVLPLLDKSWDLIIAHPPCTYLANSGVRWLYKGGRKENGLDTDRLDKMKDAIVFFKACLNANANLIAVKNPVMHGHTKLPSPNFTIQPWQFGHGETKRTCFWTKNLPPLKPTNIVNGRDARIHNEPPAPDRWKKRSITYPGIAKAIAEQWGSIK